MSKFQNPEPAPTILIERVENGYIIRDASYMRHGGDMRPIMVAESVGTLMSLVGQWAAPHDGTVSDHALEAA